MGSSLSLDNLDAHATSRLSEWGVTRQDMETVIKTMKHDNLSLPDKLCVSTKVTPLEAAVFLYVKDVHTSLNDTRELACKLLKPQPSAVSCLHRLVRLLEHPRDMTLDRPPPEVQSFDDALRMVSPSWSHSNESFICHRDDPTLEHKLAQRVQKSGLCSLHAPVVLQHYLVARSGVSSNANGMVDVSTVIRKRLKMASDQLTRHIVDDQGGSSHAFLASLLLSNSDVVAVSPDAVDREFLLSHGPLLVSRFHVYDDFYQGNSCVFHAWSGTGENHGGHAMVLIGVRMDNAGQRFFLLQNWWTKRQFIEVSYHYLVKSNAILHSVKTVQDRFPQPFDEVHFQVCFAETESCVDKPEKLDDEW